MTTRKGTIYRNTTTPQIMNPRKKIPLKSNQINLASVNKIDPLIILSKDAGRETEPIAESIKETLNAKTKEELIDELAKLINAENTADNTCNSDKIKNALMSFINKYKPHQVAVPTTNKDIDVVIDVYADKDKNSKGYHIYNYRVRAVNEEYPFSTDDEVKYFLKHLFGYIENSNLPVEARKEDISNFFRSYSKTIKEIPIVEPSAIVTRKPVEGGRNNKSHAKQSQKRKHSKRYNARRRRGSNKTIKKH
jgi:hypothetical protein